MSQLTSMLPRQLCNLYSLKDKEVRRILQTRDKETATMEVLLVREAGVDLAAHSLAEHLVAEV